MKTANFYILNTKTEFTFDSNENRFYPSSWEVETDEKHYLEGLMKADPERFENCVIVEDIK